jgi:hypothetical protein
VYRVAGDVAQAADAAGSTDIGGGAFGVLCGFLVPPVGIAAAAAGRAIHAAEAMLERSAGRLRGVSDDMAAFEDEAVHALATLEHGFG